MLPTTTGKIKKVIKQGVCLLSFFCAILVEEKLERFVGEAAHEKRNQDSLCLVVTVVGDDWLTPNI